MGKIKIVNFIKKHKKLSLFTFFLMIYCTAGVLISYFNILNINIFFDADNARAFNDFMLIKDEFLHYRIKVHPLMLILFQPLMLMANGLVNDTHLTLIIMQAILGASSVVCVYNLISYIKLEEKFKLVLVLIFGFGFSTLLFSTIPETFLFAGFFIMLFINYLFYLIDKKIDIRLPQRILLCLFGIICFGTTITNYFAYFIGICYLFIEKYGFKDNLKKIITELIKINLFNLMLVVTLSLIQKLIWLDAPYFWSQFNLSGNGANFEEVRYMNFSINLEKLYVWFKQVFIFPFVSSKPYLINTQEIVNIFFSSLTIPIKSFTLVFYSTFLIGFISSIKNKINKRIIFITLMLLSNLMLHYIYGYAIAFIYSPHFAFLFIILLAELLVNVSRKYIKTYIYIALLASLLLIIFINGYNYYQLIIITRDFCGSSYSIIQTITIIVLMFSIFILIFCISFNVIKNNFKISFKNKSLDAKFIILLSIYLLFTIIICLFIRVNYWRI